MISQVICSFECRDYQRCSMVFMLLIVGVKTHFEFEKSTHLCKCIFFYLEICYYNGVNWNQYPCYLHITPFGVYGGFQRRCWIALQILKLLAFCTVWQGCTASRLQQSGRNMIGRNVKGFPYQNVIAERTMRQYEK